MLKILNNDKFTTAQNRHSLVSLKIPILNTLPERAASSQPRATPWVSAYKRLRPVRAKVWANSWLLLLPLQGVGNGDMAPRALPWAGDLLGFQPAHGRRQGFFRTIFIYLIFLNFERPPFMNYLLSPSTIL